MAMDTSARKKPLVEKPPLPTAPPAIFAPDLAVRLNATGRFDHFREHEYEQALAALDADLAAEPNYRSAHIDRGNALVSLGRYPEAIAAYNTALAIKDSGYADAPHTIEMYRNLGTALIATGRYSEAVGAFEVTLKHEPKCAYAHKYRGIALAASGRYPEASAAFDTAVALDFGPITYSRSYTYGESFRTRSRFVVAVKYTANDEKESKTNDSLSAKTSNRNFLAHCNHGYACFLSGSFQQALTAYKAAIDTEPTAVWAYYNYGLVLAASGQHWEAIAAFDTALAINPKLIRAHIDRGIAFAELGRYSEAVAALRATLAIDPTSIDTLNERAAEMCHLGRPEIALSISAAILTNHSSNATAYKTHIEALEALERAAVAVKYSVENEKEENKTEKTEEKSAYLSPSGIEGFHNHLMVKTNTGNKEFLAHCNDGYICFLSGKFEQALSAYEAAILSKDQALITYGDKSISGSDGEELAEYGAALIADYDYAWMYYNYALVLTALKRYTEAEKYYQIALSKATSINTSKGPRLAKIHCARGVNFAAREQHKEALKCYEQAMALDPHDARIHHYHSISLEKITDASKKEEGGSSR